MKDVKELDRLCYFLDQHQLPKEHNLFMNYHQCRETEEWLAKFPSGVVIFKTSVASKLPHPITIKYRSYTFNIFEY